MQKQEGGVDGVSQMTCIACHVCMRSTFTHGLIMDSIWTQHGLMDCLPLRLINTNLDRARVFEVGVERVSEVSRGAEKAQMNLLINRLFFLRSLILVQGVPFLSRDVRTQKVSH